MTAQPPSSEYRLRVLSAASDGADADKSHQMIQTQALDGGFWLGGGAVNLKLEVQTREFVAAMAPIVADVTFKEGCITQAGSAAVQSAVHPADRTSSTRMVHSGA